MDIMTGNPVFTTIDDTYQKPDQDLHARDEKTGLGLRRSKWRFKKTRRMYCRDIVVPPPGGPLNFVPMDIPDDQQS